MQRYILPLLAMGLLAAAARPARAQAAFDGVKRAEGTIRGEITGISPLTVVIEKQGVEEKVPVNEVLSLTFTGEPSELAFGRIAALNGRYEDAVETLGKIDLSKVERPPVKQDIEFYKALAAAKLALGGNGSIQEAGKLMVAFESQNKTSYHYLEASEIIGDLLVALGNYAGAENYYNRLAKAPWPEYKMRAGVLVGRALQAQDKHAEAIARFDQVLALDGMTPQANMQKLAATLGKAVSLAAGGKVPEALKMVQSVIRDASPENVELQARAYNALGNCYLKADKTKDALLAFLHTDVLYNSFPEAHAEALARLSKLWNKVGNAARGRDAAALLHERYPASVWAKQ